MPVQGKVALITGGASGLGFSYAIELLKNGLKGVTLADNDETKGHEAVSQITKDFGPNKVLFVKTDVADKNQVENAFKKTVEKFNNLDIVVNNAGIMNDLLWEKQISINLNGTIYGCFLAMEEYLPKYRSKDEGIIVNISSSLGLAGISFLPIYSATKHAVIGLSKSLGTKKHYETTKVRVLALCPGATATPLLMDLDKKMMNDRYKQLLEDSHDDSRDNFPVQPIDVMPKALMTMLKEGANGSVWLAECEEIHEIEIPHRNQMKK